MLWGFSTRFEGLKWKVERIGKSSNGVSPTLRLWHQNTKASQPEEIRSFAPFSASRRLRLYHQRPQQTWPCAECAHRCKTHTKAGSHRDTPWHCISGILRIFVQQLGKTWHTLCNMLERCRTSSHLSPHLHQQPHRCRVLNTFSVPRLDRLDMFDVFSLWRWDLIAGKL